MELGVFLLTIASGFAGTLAMTLVMYMYAGLTKTNTKVVHILGLMVIHRMMSECLPRHFN